MSRDNQFLYWYSWGLTYVVLVGCNAALNPVVMMCRISKMRDCLGNVMRFCGGKRGAVRLRSLRSCHEVEMTPAMGRNSVVNNVSELRRVSQLSVSGCSSQGSRASTVYLPINNRHTAVSPRDLAARKMLLASSSQNSSLKLPVSTNSALLAQPVQDNDCVVNVGNGPHA